jgi:hypothetical protein
LTTLIDEHGALVVRCDECRRLWPVTRVRLEAVWEHDDEHDLHRCPVCVRPRAVPLADSRFPGSTTMLSSD